MQLLLFPSLSYRLFQVLMAKLKTARISKTRKIGESTSAVLNILRCLFTHMFSLAHLYSLYNNAVILIIEWHHSAISQTVNTNFPYQGIGYVHNGKLVHYLGNLE